MVQSLNAKADLVDEGTWFRGMAVYGKVMVGDKGFEFYNDKNVNDYIQIPWAEVNLVVADVYFRGRYIPRFEFRTQQNGNFIFAARHPKKVLRAISRYIPKNKMRQALTLWGRIKAAFVSHN